MSLKRRKSRRTRGLNDWQRLAFSISCAALDKYGDSYPAHFRDPQHRREVWEANRSEILADRDPQLPGARPTAFWEYEFGKIYRAAPNRDKWGLVRLDSRGVPEPYQADAAGDYQPDILHCFGLLTAQETLALRRMYPLGNEWRCPRFLMREPAEPAEPGEVVTFPRKDES